MSLGVAIDTGIENLINAITGTEADPFADDCPVFIADPGAVHVCVDPQIAYKIVSIFVFRSAENFRRRRIRTSFPEPPNPMNRVFSWLP